MKKVHGLSSGNKSQITVLACSNAVGVPPMVIFKGERLDYKWTKGEAPSTVYGMSPQGWIDHVRKIVYKNIPDTRPVMLLLDGHSSHYIPEAIKAAAENDIVLFCLPPCSSTSGLNFGPLKKHWSSVCHMYVSDNPGKVVTKFIFPHF